MRGRFLVLLAATGCATATPDETPPSYLALGDSVAFGYSPLVDLNTDQVRGYPEMLADQRGMAVTNLACPGEASGGFMDPNGADNGCRENRTMYPLHVAYTGTQLLAAVDYLEQHPGTQLVTIDLGANDMFLLDHLCAHDATCILENFVPTMTAYQFNLHFIFTQLRRVYKGPIVGLAIYDPTPMDSTAEYAIGRLDDAFASLLAEFDGVVADGKAAFAAHGDPCATGLLIQMPDGTCDVHPTPAGAQILADTIDAAVP
jgi:lysophospholipase L1-like esterase